MAVENYNTISDIFNRTLDRGVSESNGNGEVCCPDCFQRTNNGGLINVYVLASVETYLKFAEAISLYNSCCIQVTASIETSLKYSEAVGDNNHFRSNCPDNYNSCINELKNSLTYEGVDRLLDKGIVEYGSIDGSSQICIINEYINTSLSADTLNTYTKSQILDRILDKGIVISCLDDEITIGSVETWLKYAEASNLTMWALPLLNVTGDTITQSGDTTTQV